MLSQRLVYQDLSKVGFLPKQQIKGIYAECGIPINQRQVDTLCQVLNTDNMNNFCYIEMISLLFGEGFMMKIRDENGINVQANRTIQSENMVELEQKRLTPELQAQIELKLMQLEANVN